MKPIVEETVSIPLGQVNWSILNPLWFQSYNKDANITSLNILKAKTMGKKHKDLVGKNNRVILHTCINYKVIYTCICYKLYSYAINVYILLFLIKFSE